MEDFKKNINSWSPKENEWQQGSKEYKEQLGKYATTISGLLAKNDEKLIGTFDIESTLLNGKMIHSALSTYNTANPGAIALIRLLKEQKDVQYESSIASIASAEYFDAYKLLDQDTFFKNDTAYIEVVSENDTDNMFSVQFWIYDKNHKPSYISGIKKAILNKITDKTQKEKMQSLLKQLNLDGLTSGTLAKKHSVVFEALYRKFILAEKNINMLFFDNDIEYIDSTKKGITNFLDSKLVKSNDSEETVGHFLTELGITITPICAASGHITFDKEGVEDYNQPRTGAVFLNDLAREVMAKQGLHQNEIDKKMLEAEKICFEEYVERKQYNKLDDKETAINTHITDLKRQIADKETLISAPPPPPPVLAPTVKNNTIVVKKCTTSGSGLLCFMHAAFGEKNGNDSEYKCSDANIEQKTKELKDSIIADVNQAFDSDSEADKKRLIEEYTSLVGAEIAETSDEKNLLQTSLYTLNNAEISDHDKKEAIINFINNINSTFPLIWLRYATQMVKKNITVVTKNSSSNNLHINDYRCDSQDNIDNIYIFFDNQGIGHFSRCEKIDYKEKLDADEINVSDIRLEQAIEEIYAKQRGIIDDMKEYNKEKIDECINKIISDVNSNILDLKGNDVIVDDNFVDKLITEKNLVLDGLIAKKESLVAPTIILNDEQKGNPLFKIEKNYEYRGTNNFLENSSILKTKKFVNGNKDISTIFTRKKLGSKKPIISSLIKTSSAIPTIILNNAQKPNSLLKEQTKTVNNHYLSSEIVSNKVYTPVYAVNNYAPNKIGEKIMSSSVNNSFKIDQDKDISKDYSNPYIAKLKELQEKAQKIGIFSRITLAIFSWFSSSSAKKRSAIKKLKTISIKNQDEPNYKDDKEMYDLLKKCLDDNKSFVSDIPTLPLENDIIYNNKKMQATQFDPRDIPATPLGAMHNSLEIFKEKIINFINSVPNKLEDNKELAKKIFDSSEELMSIVNILSIEISDDRLNRMIFLMNSICESTGRIISNNKNFKYDYKTESGLLFDSLKLLIVNTQNFLFDGIGDPKLSQVKTQSGNINNHLEGIQKDIEGTLNNSHQSLYQQRVVSGELNNGQLCY